jgi:hypothetical protein
LEKKRAAFRTPTPSSNCPTPTITYTTPKLSKELPNPNQHPNGVNLPPTQFTSNPQEQLSPSSLAKQNSSSESVKESVHLPQPSPQQTNTSKSNLTNVNSKTSTHTNTNTNTNTNESTSTIISNFSFTSAFTKNSSLTTTELPQSLPLGEKAHVETNPSHNSLVEVNHNSIRLLHLEHQNEQLNHKITTLSSENEALKENLKAEKEMCMKKIEGEKRSWGEERRVMKGEMSALETKVMELLKKIETLNQECNQKV